MNNENRNEEAVSPVIATILMVAITVVLAGVLYVWASSLADDSTGGGLDTYQFSDRDAAGSMSEAGGDALVHIAMTQGYNISWDALTVKIVVDGGASLTCDEGSYADATSECVWSKDDDDVWSVSEEITILEGSETDLCDGTNGGCEVEVSLHETGGGPGGEDIMWGVSTYADASN